jgi:hypothetical protein
MSRHVEKLSAFRPNYLMIREISVRLNDEDESACNELVSAALRLNMGLVLLRGTCAGALGGICGETIQAVTGAHLGFDVDDVRDR